jgi:iron complex outermembrane receptor protein
VKPDWTGNPTLDPPARASLRGQLATRLATLELGGSWVDGYVLPVARRAGTTPHVTYANADAALLSGRASGRLAWAEWTLAYTLGWNLDAGTELAEVAPFAASLVARPPLGAGVDGLVRIETAARQYRVDESLGEAGTPAWGRLDLGLRWSPRPGAGASLEVVNVTDALYGEHLSYARDPFAAGLRVMSPGRTVRLAVTVGE